MTDVVEIAKERRAKLKAEVAKLDEFIRMAEKLVKFSQGLNRGPVMGADSAVPKGRLADRDHDADFIRKDVKARDSGTVTPIERAVTVEYGVQNVALQYDPAHNEALTQAIETAQVDYDHFAFNDNASVNENELVLINPLSSSATSVDVYVGQRMRQRRWMLGISQQDLADNVGVKLEQIQKYETGAIHISAGRMWDVAAAMKVPMTHFFEGIGGQAPDTGEARGDILTDKEALALVRGAPHVRTAKAS
jgi:transcriptional regulator with XRE-family HTH domain